MDAARKRSPTGPSASRSRTWPTPSRRSRSSAATTSPSTRSTASAQPAASTPASSPTRSAWRRFSSTRFRACCRPMAWASPPCGRAASARSRRSLMRTRCARSKTSPTSWAAPPPRSCWTKGSSTTTSRSRPSSTCATPAPTPRSPWRCRSPASCAAISRRCTGSGSGLPRRRRRSSRRPSRWRRAAAAPSLHLSQG